MLGGGRPWQSVRVESVVVLVGPRASPDVALVAEGEEHVAHAGEVERVEALVRIGFRLRLGGGCGLASTGEDEHLLEVDRFATNGAPVESVAVVVARRVLVADDATCV